MLLLHNPDKPLRPVCASVSAFANPAGVAIRNKSFLK